ncbi:MAG: hypothetical protein H3C26_15770 [Rhodocyclaceae bacterium]|nr:hypothetical protein [Rhodocyclaceae bacterium]
MSNPWLDAASAVAAAVADFPELHESQALGGIAEQIFSAQSELARIAAALTADNPEIADAIVRVADLLTDAVGTARRLSGHPEPPLAVACFHAAPDIVQ